MNFCLILSVFCLFTASCYIGSGQGAKILSVFGYPAPSHYFFISPLLKALAEKGHEVTSISTFPQKEPVNNFRDIPIMENIQIFNDLLTNTAEGPAKSHLKEYLEFVNAGKLALTNILENLKVQQMMQNETFDLIILEVFFTDAWLGWSEWFNAPVVAVSTFGTVRYIDYLVGNPSPLSYTPHIKSPFDTRMSLSERIENVLMQITSSIIFNLVVLPQQEKLYKKYFSTATRTLDEARKNVSLVLLNDHFSLRYARPYVPNMIQVGGLQIKQQPDPLPEDLQTLLDNATDGAIYFSMGSNIKSKNLPKEKLKAILDTFRELNIKVLWKFEMDELSNKPDNVLIRPWYPQPSVLAHPNVKLFISHGGYLSTTETIFHGKPILGIPLLGDQFMNVKNAVRAGYALSLNLAELSKESFNASIQEIWTNSKYTQAVQRLSRRYRDQPLTPMETAIYWVEYVLRHEGAPHMRNAGQDLNFMALHNIDVYMILFGVLLASVAVIVLLIRKLICRCLKLTKKSPKIKAKIQ